MPRVNLARPATTRSGPVLLAAHGGGKLFLNNVLGKKNIQNIC